VNAVIPPPLRDYFERSHIALSLAAAGEDNPLLLVNRVFLDLTGYDEGEMVGHNCRLLQRDVDNAEARQRLREFLASERQASVRTPIVNFRKDGRPFVNLLYMSKLRRADGSVEYIFASQFDVSRSQPDLLSAYDVDLGQAIHRLSPALAEAGMVLEGSLTTIANTAATVAQAKLTLSQLDSVSFP
jgi:PAS domain S-box-containing protein